MKSKKVLFITPYEFRKPSSGGETRINAIFSVISKSHRVTLVTRGATTTIHRDDGVIYNKKGRLNQIFNYQLFRNLRKKIKKSGIEVIFANTIWSGLMGGLLGLATKEHVVLDEHNVEFIRFWRLKSPLFLPVYFFELLVCHLADRVFFVSGTDAAMAEKYLFLKKHRIRILPNGVSIPETLKQVNLASDPEGRKIVLFFGNLNYRPNRQALSIIHSELVPRLKTEKILLLVAGRGKLAKADPAVRYLSFVPDLADYIYSADLVIVPLVSGSGTRLKILESIAAGTRVLSTKIGAEGIDVSVCGDNLHLVNDNDWEEFAKQTVILAGKTKVNPDPAFFQKYDWVNILRNDLFT